MKAVFFESHGGTEVLQYGDLPMPRPQPGEVVIQVRAAAMNFNDIWARQGMPGMAVPLPHVSGSDAAGVIVELGEGVTHWHVGDEVCVNAIQSCGVCLHCVAGQDVFCKQMLVWGFQTGPYIGAYAQYARVQARQLIPKPARLSWTDAAATPSALASIWRMLVTRARVQPGETVLIFGASGGTGSFAVQLVRAMGGVAIAVTSSERKEIFCHELGAHHVIRSDRDNVVQAVKRLTGRRGVDVVFDHAGENTWQLGVASLTWGGRLVICGATEGFNAKIDLRHLWNKQLSLLGSHAFTQGELMAAMRMVDDGRLRPFVTEVIGLQDLGDAQQRMQQRQTLGKLAVEIAHD